MKKSKYLCVVTVADMQSISRAANALGVSQPALTKTINSIEEDYGVKLFDRSTIPLRLTTAGKAFVNEARRIISLENSIEKEMLSCAESRNQLLTVACGFTVSSLWLPYIYRIFEQKYPDTRLVIRSTHGPSTEIAVLNETADLAFSQLPLRNSELDYTELPPLPRVFLVSRRNPVLKGMDIPDNSISNPVHLTVAHLKNQSFCTLNPEEPSCEELMTFLNANKINPNKITHFNNNFAVYRSVLANLGIAVISPEFATLTSEAAPVICVVEGFVPAPMQYVISYQKAKKPLSKLAYDFIEVTREVIRDHS